MCTAATACGVPEAVRRLNNPLCYPVHRKAWAPAVTDFRGLNFETQSTLPQLPRLVRVRETKELTRGAIPLRFTGAQTPRPCALRLIVSRTTPKSPPLLLRPGASNRNL